MRFEWILLWVSTIVGQRHGNLDGHRDVWTTVARKALSSCHSHSPDSNGLMMRPDETSISGDLFEMQLRNQKTINRTLNTEHWDNDCWWDHDRVCGYKSEINVISPGTVIVPDTDIGMSRTRNYWMWSTRFVHSAALWHRMRIGARNNLPSPNESDR